MSPLQAARLLKGALVPLSQYNDSELEAAFAEVIGAGTQADRERSDAIFAEAQRRGGECVEKLERVWNESAKKLVCR